MHRPVIMKFNLMVDIPQSPAPAQTIGISTTATHKLSYTEAVVVDTVLANTRIRRIRFCYRSMQFLPHAISFRD
jgi:hypothetical protein